MSSPRGEREPPQAPTVPARSRHRKGDTEAMIAVIARGGTQGDAGLAAGLSTREVRRRLDEPDVRQRLRDIETERRRRMRAQVAAGSEVGLNTLRDLCGDEHPPHVRLQAARSLVGFDLRDLAALDAQAQLRELQRTVDALEADKTTP